MRTLEIFYIFISNFFPVFIVLSSLFSSENVIKQSIVRVYYLDQKNVTKFLLILSGEKFKHNDNSDWFIRFLICTTSGGTHIDQSNSPLRRQKAEMTPFFSQSQVSLYLRIWVVTSLTSEVPWSVVCWLFLLHFLAILYCSCTVR